MCWSSTRTSGTGNLDGLVSFDDYVGMDNAFFGLIQNLGWATGDINFDGVINFDDYTVVDQAFFFQGPPLSGESAGGSSARTGDDSPWLHWGFWRSLDGAVADESNAAGQFESDIRLFVGASIFTC